MILIWSIGDGTPIGAAWASISKIWYAAWSPLARRRRCRSYAWWPSIGKTCDWAKNWDFSEAIYQETSGYRCVCFLILKWWFNGVEPKKSTYISDFLCFFWIVRIFMPFPKFIRDFWRNQRSKVGSFQEQDGDANGDQDASLHPGKSMGFFRRMPDFLVGKIWRNHHLKRLTEIWNSMCFFEFFWKSYWQKCVCFPYYVILCDSYVTKSEVMMNIYRLPSAKLTACYWKGP